MKTLSRHFPNTNSLAFGVTTSARFFTANLLAPSRRETCLGKSSCAFLLQVSFIGIVFTIPVIPIVNRLLTYCKVISLLSVSCDMPSLVSTEWSHTGYGECIFISEIWQIVYTTRVRCGLLFLLASDVSEISSWNVAPPE